jgi:hypothetical protein
MLEIALDDLAELASAGRIFRRQGFANVYNLGKLFILLLTDPFMPSN